MQCCQTEKYISIHSLRMEGDIRNVAHRHIGKVFQSTPSAWRETKTFQSVYKATTDFNPLPPHGGRPLCPPQIWRTGHFNPLPPHGGRRYKPDASADIQKFQSTPSAWRETHGVSRHLRVIRISIHSLRMEGDTFAWMRENGYLIISIHSLRMEGDHRSR